MNCVDVVIPCYNYARFLSQAVASVLEQDGVNVRVLIIDDCSTDNSRQVGLHLAKQDTRVEFARHSKNHGHIATYNEGLLGWASAEYSLLLSADDALAPGALFRATHIMENNRDVTMTCGMAQIIGDDEDYTTAAINDSVEYQIISSDRFLHRFVVKGNSVITPTAVVRTKIQKRLGGYRSDLPHSGDMEMWMRFASLGSIGILRAVQAYYRIHRNNMSLQYYNQLLGDRREVLQACEETFVRCRANFPEFRSWMEKLHQRLSEETCWSASLAFDDGHLEEYHAYLKFAEQIYPKIRKSAMWRKIRFKEFLGLNLWHDILPIWKRLRQRRNLQRKEQTPIDPQAIKLVGWWPESPER